MDQTTIDRALLGDPEATKKRAEVIDLLESIVPSCANCALKFLGESFCAECKNPHKAELIKIAIQALRALDDRADLRGMGKEAPQQWIPVGEQLPTVGQSVLVHDGLLVGTGQYIGLGYLTAKTWDWWGGAMQPTHWMPLPQPPITGGDT